jgi:hypothetical protein
MEVYKREEGGEQAALPAWPRDRAWFPEELWGRKKMRGGTLVMQGGDGGGDERC